MMVVEEPIVFESPSGRVVTEKQLASLDFIARYIIINGWGPSLRELCEGLSLGSLNSANARLVALERHSLIQRGGIHRTVRVTRLGYSILAQKWNVPFDETRP